MELSSEQLQEKLLQCLGGAFPKPGPLKPEYGETIHEDGYRVEKVSYEVEMGQKGPVAVRVSIVRS